MKTLIDKYKSLPEANRVPDSVWTVQNMIDDLAAIEKRRLELSFEIETASILMLSDLIGTWSKQELREAGLLS